MFSQQITRDDVPYIYRPKIIRIHIIGGILFWLTLTVCVNDLRPGLLELLVGVLFGLPFGYLFSKTSILYLTGVAATSHTKPKLKWMACFMHPAQFNKGYYLDSLAKILFMMVGLFGINFLLYGIHQVLPFLTWPIAKFNHNDIASKSIVMGSWPSTMLAYILTTGLIIARNITSWYYSLPDNS